MLAPLMLIHLAAAPPTPPPEVQALFAHACAHHSDAVALQVDGVVYEERCGQKPGLIHAMSVTKSVVALAFGFLLEEGRLPSLDVPVHEVLPAARAWANDERRAITVRQLLEHTSGLAARPTTEAIYASDDFVTYAVDAELAEPPGKVFRYNNRAYNLLPAIVQARSGEPIDIYLGSRLFAPLGVEQIRWDRDRVGNRQGMSGLMIDARGLLAIGVLLLNDGVYDGRRLLSEQSARLFTTPRDDAEQLEMMHGWWRAFDGSPVRVVISPALFERFQAAGVPAADLEKLKPLVGVSLPPAEWSQRVNEALGGEAEAARVRQLRQAHDVPGAEPVLPPLVGVRADGFLGQHVVVLPELGVVAVRQRRSGNGEVNDRGANLGDFPVRVFRAAQALRGAAGPS